MSDRLGRPEETVHEWWVTRELACEARSRAMHVINARRKGGSHGHASAPHYIGDFDIPVFHRTGCYRPRASPLNRYPHRGARRSCATLPRYRLSVLSQRHRERGHGGPTYPFGTGGAGCSGCDSDRRVIQRNFNYAISTMKGKAGYDIAEREK